MDRRRDLRKKFAGVKPLLPRTRMTQCGNGEGVLALQGPEGRPDVRILATLREVEGGAAAVVEDFLDGGRGPGWLGRLRGGGRGCRRGRGRCGSGTPRHGLLDDLLELPEVLGRAAGDHELRREPIGVRLR